MADSLVSKTSAFIELNVEEAVDVDGGVPRLFFIVTAPPIMFTTRQNIKIP